MSELTETVQTEDRIVDYSGRGFINMINKYYMYNINKTRNMTFLEIDPKCFFLKLCDIDGRDVHNFSKKYNNGIVHKFDLEDDKKKYPPKPKAMIAITIMIIKALLFFFSLVLFSIFDSPLL